MRAGDEITIEATELVAGGAAMARVFVAAVSVAARARRAATRRRAWFTSATARWDALRFFMTVMEPGHACLRARVHYLLYITLSVLWTGRRQVPASETAS